MKNFKSLVYVCVASIVLFGCTDEKPKVEKENAVPICFYSYNSGTTIMEWTAFKFTEKVPVKGTFSEINIEGTLESDDPMVILESLNFSIPTNSISSQNDERDGKIIKYFFGAIGTEKLTGKVVRLEKNGKAIVEITMNSSTKRVTGNYNFVDGKFDFSAVIDLVNWDAQGAIDALNTICKDLHTSADGKSKLWSEVELLFSTTLKSDCE